MDGAVIHHLALAEDWIDAQRVGRYPWSTRGATFAEVGYVHCSFEHQWKAVRERFYSDLPDASLVLLVIDEERLRHPVVVERLDGAPEAFPHVYAEIDLDAVIEVRDLGAPDLTASE